MQAVAGRVGLGHPRAQRPQPGGSQARFEYLAQGVDISIGDRITALDLPSVLLRTRAAVSAAGLGERFRFRPGDMFATPLEPAAYDTVLLANVCHLFDDTGCARLFARLAPSLRPGGRLVIVDVLRKPNRFGDRDSALHALYELGLSLRTATGRIHPVDDYDRWARAAGLSGVQTFALGVHPPLDVIVATAPEAESG